MSNSSNRVEHSGLSIDGALHQFIANEVLAGTGISADQFWAGFADIVATLTPENKALLAKRASLQQQIDEWNKNNRLDDNLGDNMAGYIDFLRSIGYVVAEGEDFTLQTANTDKEVAEVAAVQLVVPASNARFALNAANARWGSLFDALYGTDVIAESDGAEKGNGYNPKRGAKVIDWALDFLDKHLPLADGSHADVSAYQLTPNTNGGEGSMELSCQLANGTTTTLKEAGAWVGHHNGTGAQSLFFIHHGLHIELVINREHPVGATVASGLCDVILESALSTIVDGEDSVAAVDAEDKITVYKNWLGLMKGDLTASFSKGGKTVQRHLSRDKTLTNRDGEVAVLHGRSLLLVRNVGHLMSNDAVLDSEGNEVFEGLLDAMVTVACALHDINRVPANADNPIRNSRRGSVYVVKPKMHGPEEAAFTDKLFSKVEGILSLPANTVKVGLMDEERRTSANLKECIRALRHRLFFINTGFLDRTGDEIHTGMAQGAVVPKNKIKQEQWIATYEARNVLIGLQCGLQGRAQIGKGMWAKPDCMSEMLATKATQLQQGASCAWVPSPTAAVLHATHYHAVDVWVAQQQLAKNTCPPLSELFAPALLGGNTPTAADIQLELENNAQGILGYVVRWVEQGIGCSKVLGIDNVGLMEDRATLRISSQHIANWLYHGICDKAQVQAVMEKMAAVVDGQNAGDPNYRPMSPNFTDSVAFRTACALVFAGAQQPNGYTEPLLHQSRREFKSKL